VQRSNPGQLRTGESAKVDRLLDIAFQHFWIEYTDIESLRKRFGGLESPWPAVVVAQLEGKENEYEHAKRKRKRKYDKQVMSHGAPLRNKVENENRRRQQMADEEGGGRTGQRRLCTEKELRGTVPKGVRARPIRESTKRSEVNSLQRTIESQQKQIHELTVTMKKLSQTLT
jgi:hypothetical protein